MGKTKKPNGDRRTKNGKRKKPKAKAKGKAKKKAKVVKEKKNFDMVSDETDGPIDLDEVEVATELVLMDNSSSSSSSSSTDSFALECGNIEMNLVEDDSKVVELA